MTRMIKRFVREEEGLETVEYAIMLGLIVVATIGFVGSIGQWVSDQFEAVDTALETAGN